MRRKMLAVLGAAMVTAGALVLPAATQAQTRVHSAALKDHCIVKTLPDGLQLTLCYVT
jgi:hypothetical protein